MSILETIGPFILMFVVFYFILIVPEKKIKKKYCEMLNELQANDRIITRGGIIGKIIKVTDESVVIETSSDRTKLEITKQAIGTRVEK